MERFPTSDYANNIPPSTTMVAATAPTAPPRERTKRPQLSCNPCRARKVKCDRIQPCTACSLHQIAEICHYDLSEQERQPILQAEALKEKDKAIAHLQSELQLLRGHPIKNEPNDEDTHVHQPRKMRLPPRTSKRSIPHEEEETPVQQENQDTHMYLTHPGITNVADEFAHLSFNKLTAGHPSTINRMADIFSFPMTTSHPFPTLWSAKDDTSTIFKLLPSEEDLFYYVDSFQQRALALSFPHVPGECTHMEVQKFIENIEHNAALHPDVLALLFATLALGLQEGIYSRCGERWISGSVEAESKKGDVYIAASMQCLRLSCFLNRPTLCTIEALVMMGPYLTNSGKFLDASALFGVTVRLAQSIGLHRDPSQIHPPVSGKEASARKRLWWWMLHMDQQYSMTLGRPLAIFSPGDCPSPDPVLPNANSVSLSNYQSHFSLLARQVLSAGALSDAQIDKYSDDLVSLHSTLTSPMQFDSTWLNDGKPLPIWPLDAQASLVHAKTHNLLILLNRQRTEKEKDRRDTSHQRFARSNVTVNHQPRGRERVLQSCRALLRSFEFLKNKCEAALMCWTMGQMAFNAAMLLTLSMLETGETKDLLPVQHVYSTFLDMNKLGIHKLAGAAVDRLGALMKEFRSEDSIKQSVMGQHGMMLLEDPILPASSLEGFAPINDQMGGGGFNPAALFRAATNASLRAESSQFPRKRNGRRQSREHKSQQQRASKKANKSQRQVTDRRFSDSVTPRPQQRRRTNCSTPNLTLMDPHPGQSVFSAASTPTLKTEAIFPPPPQQSFEGYPTTPRFSSASHHNMHDLRLNLDDIHHPPPQSAHHYFAPQHQHQQQQQQQQQQQSNPQPLPSQQGQHHHAASDPGNPNDFTFSTQSTPYSSEFFEDSSSLPNSIDQSPFEHPPFSAPPFSLPGDPQGAGAFGGHF